MGVEREFLENTLPEIENTLRRILGDLQSSVRYPVDCVAFNSTIAVDGKTVLHHDAACHHPDRGKQMGCLLTREDKTGKVIRIKGAECKFRTKNDEKGAAELSNRIALQEEPQF